MSIQNERIEYLTEKILKENLQKGLLPDSKEFVWQLNQGLYDLNNDKSSFSFKPYRNTEILTSKKLNEDNEKIFEDLYSLYKNNDHVNNLLNREYQYFLIKKKKLEKELDIEENRLRQYVQNSARPGILPYAYDTFDTTDKVDLNKTTGIFLDTNNNTAKFVEERKYSKRIFPNSNLEFTVLPRTLDLKEDNIEGSLSNILKDTEDSVWQKQLFSKTNEIITGNLVIDFDRPHQLNNINLSLFTVNPVHLLVEFSRDGNSWYNIPYHEDEILVEKEIALDFPEIEVKSLKFTLTKNEYDETFSGEDDYNYKYLFGFEYISLYKKSYPSEAVLYSKELELQNMPKNYAIDTVQLKTDDWVPTNTDLTYQVALAGDSPDWQYIDPVNRKHPRFPQKVHFHNLQRNIKNELYFPSDLSIKQSEAEDLLKNGIPLYKLSHSFGGKEQFHIPSTKILEGSTRLYVGKNAAEVISYPSDGTPLKVQDFLQVQDEKKHYYHPLPQINSGDIFVNKRDDQKRKYLIRIGLYLDEPKVVSSAPVSTEDMIIYLNGNEIFQGITSPDNYAHYSFKGGWNELIILIDGEDSNTVNGVSTSLGFDFNQITKQVYSSSKSLQEVDVFDLQNNTKIHDRTVFAKREVEDGIEFLTNFAQPGLQFDLFYDYKEEFKDNDKILLKVNFTRENNENVPSPLIRQYRLEFS